LRITKRCDNAGLFGVVQTGEISNLSVSGDVRGYNNVGILCGYLQSNAHNVLTRGIVDGESHVGGCVGEFDYGYRIRNVSNYAEVNGNSGVGGVIGCIYPHTSSLWDASYVENCINYGTVKGDMAGGILGYLYYYWGTKAYVFYLNNCCNMASDTGRGILGRYEESYYGDRYKAENYFWLNDIVNNRGSEDGGLTGGKYSYFTQTTNNCLLLQLQDKDLVETLNQWVEDNGSDRYCKWKYEIVGGNALPVMEQLK